MIIEKPIISDKFDVDDIRKIRDYNAKRYLNMTNEEIIEEVNSVAADMVKKYNLKPANIYG